MQMVGGYVPILDQFVTIDSVGSGLKKKRQRNRFERYIIYIFYTK